MAVISIILVYLGFFAFPSINLKLEIPTRSQDGKTVYLEWATNAGDPEIAYMEIYSEKLESPIMGPLPLRVQDRQYSFNPNPSSLTTSSSNDYRLYAFLNTSNNNPRLDPPKLIAQTEVFTTFKVKQAVATSSSISPVAPTSTSSKRPEPSISSPTEAHGSPTQSATSRISNAQESQVGSSSGEVSITDSFSGSSSNREIRTSNPGTPSTSVELTLVPTPTPSTINNPPTSAHHVSHRGAIIGGTLGGVAFLAFIVAFLLYCRNKRKKNHLDSGITPSRQTRRSGSINVATSRDQRYTEVPEGEAVGPVQNSRVPTPPQHQSTHDPIANMTSRKDNFIQEGNRERADLVGLGTEESQRGPDMIQIGSSTR